MVESNKKSVRLQIWDTAGQERFRAVTTIYFRGADAGVLCCDLTSPINAQAMLIWLKEFRDTAATDVPIFIVGTKAEDPSLYQVNINELKEFAEQQNAVWKGITSAKTGAGVEELFTDIVSIALPRTDAKKEEPEITLSPPPNKTKLDEQIEQILARINSEVVKDRFVCIKEDDAIFNRYVEAFEQAKRQANELQASNTPSSKRKTRNELQKLSIFLNKLQATIDAYQISQLHIAEYGGLVQRYSGYGVSKANLQSIKAKREVIDSDLKTLYKNLIALDRSVMSGWQKLIDIVAVFIGSLIAALGAGLGGFVAGTTALAPTSPLSGPIGPFAGGLVGAGLLGVAGGVAGGKIAHKLVTKGIFSYNLSHAMSNQAQSHSINDSVSQFSGLIDNSLSQSRMTANDMEMRNTVLEKDLSTFHKLTR